MGCKGGYDRCDMLAILGGGVAGLSAALEAERLGLEYELIEAGPQLGGNARTFDVNGFRSTPGPIACTITFLSSHSVNFSDSSSC